MPTYEYDVAMTCGGCSGAVTRLLTKKLPECTFDIQLENKKVFVTVEGKSPEEVQEIIAKCKKETVFVGQK